MIIIKRDGTKVAFDRSKIYNAILKASRANNNELEDDDIEKLTSSVASKVTDEMSVEEIQDIVEDTLISAGYTSIAKAYILYRNERTQIRERKSKILDGLEEIYNTDAAENNLKRDNANINGNSSMGTMLIAGSYASKAYYIERLMKPEFAEAHTKGYIHIHDLDFYNLTETCCQIDAGKLLKNGFSTGHGFLRTPNGILSASALLCIILQSNQNDQHGGQSIPKFDYDLAPYVTKTFIKMFCNSVEEIVDIKYGKKINGDKEILRNKLNDFAAQNNGRLLDNFDNISAQLCKNFFVYKIPDCVENFAKAENMAREKTIAETEQAMQALIHNLNTMHSRAGAQVPFTSINYGTDISEEGRMVVRAVLKAQYEGLGHGETPIFPIHIFKVKEGVNYNLGDPNYDLFKYAIEVSAKRLFPNFSFIDAPFNFQYYKEGNPDTEVAYMGCRTRVIGNVYDPTREIVTGRGNLSFTSINLPRLAIEAKGNEEAFFIALDKMIKLCCEQLLERFEIQEKRHVYNYPFLMEQGVWIDSDKLKRTDEVGEILKHGTLSVGFIGLAETLTALIGKHHGESVEAQELGLKIIKHMRNVMDAKSKETGLNFTLLATPAEGLSGRFVRIDRKEYGVIPGVTDKEYYTNSFHIPVGYKISAYDKIKLEAPYHALTNAGHISYVEVDGDPLKNLSAFEQIIRCMKENGIGYGSINHPVDRCPECGYTGIIDTECPVCGAVDRMDLMKYGFDNNAELTSFEESGRVHKVTKIDRIRRITGYLVGTLDRWNDAKKSEEKDRVKHMNMIEKI